MYTIPIKKNISYLQILIAIPTNLLINILFILLIFSFHDMSCSDFSVDSLESSEFLNSDDKVKYCKQKTTLNTEWKLFESVDSMSVPLYSGPVSLQELKRIEVNGDKILELASKELSSINKKYLSNTANKSRVNTNNY